jgi:glycosyltransferase involved in cell wall biosynthesis
MTKTVALIGCVGVPAQYGGFETFAEHVGLAFLNLGYRVLITCDAARYANHDPIYRGLERIFIHQPANGISSIYHDFLALRAVRSRADIIIIMGVSMGPLFYLKGHCPPCIINIDGLEWRRTKFSWVKRTMLKIFEAIARRSGDSIVIDNEGLRAFLPPKWANAPMIPYGGDHVLGSTQHQSALMLPTHTVPYALTICRIEPENNIQILIEGFLLSQFPSYKIIGNWDASNYGRELRERFSKADRIEMIDPIYEPEKLHELRLGCALYIHGHSVGGTNPSLVEMIFYDAPILCYDCTFNRYTAGETASYFESRSQLGSMLYSHELVRQDDAVRNSMRRRYQWVNIARSYSDIIESLCNDNSSMSHKPKAIESNHS